jgi:hypothetical protein
MASLSEAIRDSIKELKRVRENLILAYEATLYDIGGALVWYTPVKTGLASSNWNVTNSDRSEPVREPSGTNKGDATLAAIGSQIKQLKLGSDVIYYNPVEYIEDLEAGSSRQAPSGMILPTTMRINGIWVQNLEYFKVI